MDIQGKLGSEREWTIFCMLDFIHSPPAIITTQGKPNTPFCHNKQHVQDNCRKHRQSMKAIFDRHTISSISVQIAAIPDVRENIDPPTIRGDGEVGLWRT